MPGLKPKTRVLLLALFVVAVWVFLWRCHLRDYESMQEWQTVLVVGYASLVYFDEYGKAPHSIDELLRAGLLHRAHNEYVQTPGFGLAVPMEYVRRVGLSFPDATQEFEMQGGFVRSKRSGEKLVCIRIDGRPADDKDWAYLWFRLANGELTGNDRLDELIRERRGARSRPTTEPSND
jgi:hypothetical protein